jgi:hypothetical protein
MRVPIAACGPLVATGPSSRSFSVSAKRGRSPFAESQLRQGPCFEVEVLALQCWAVRGSEWDYADAFHLETVRILRD